MMRQFLYKRGIRIQLLCFLCFFTFMPAFTFEVEFLNFELLKDSKNNGVELTNVKFLLSTQEIEIPDTVEYEGVKHPVEAIGNRAFYRGFGLKTVIIPETIIMIGDSAFASCPDLVNAELPMSLERIGDFAFFGTGVKEVNIFPDVVSISPTAFAGTEATFNVAYGNSYYGSVNGMLTDYKRKTIISYPSAKGNVDIPEGITTIDTYAFYSNTGIYSLNIPASVTTIKDYAICGNVLNVYCYPDTPPTLGIGNFSINPQTTIYVPVSSYASYYSEFCSWSLLPLAPMQPILYKSMIIDEKDSRQKKYSFKDYKKLAFNGRDIEVTGVDIATIPVNNIRGIRFSTSGSNSVISTIEDSGMRLIISDNGNTLQIAGIGKEALLRIYSLTGINIIETKYYPGESIDISSIPGGLYIVKVDNFSAKFLKY